MRCGACDRRWSGSARFCGRCGSRLPDPAPARAPRTADVGRQRGLRTLAWIAALASVATLVAVGVAGVADRSDTAAAGAVAIPTASTTGEDPQVRAADRSAEPLDCGEHLQQLPPPIRNSSLYTGTLEYRDGRLCAPLDPDAPRQEVSRCDPPDVFVCAIP